MRARVLVFQAGANAVTYWRYWKLDAAPFSRTSEQPLFRGGSVEEALARIEFLIANRRAVGSLLGHSGVGKTSVLRHCVMHPSHIDETPNLNLVCKSLLGMAGGELLSELATTLTGIQLTESRDRAWKYLCDFFQAADREDVHTVLFVDDAESSRVDAEADVCRLVAASFPLTIVFAVETQALSAINRALLERVDLQIELPGWDLVQTTEFLSWTCSRLGRKDPIFTDTAVERIHQLSNGVTRRIVQLTDLALVAGAVSQSDCIDAECVDQVAFELPKSSAA